MADDRSGEAVTALAELVFHLAFFPDAGQTCQYLDVSSVAAVPVEYESSILALTFLT